MNYFAQRVKDALDIDTSKLKEPMLAYEVKGYKGAYRHFNHDSNFITANKALVDGFVEIEREKGCNRFELNVVHLYPDNFVGDFVHPGFYCAADEASNFEFVTKNILGTVKVK